ncbi:cyclin-dependent kinase [Ranunculus cassubicifolius]
MAEIYDEIRLIDEGNYGTVYEASNGFNRVALKKIPLDKNILTKENINECFVLQALSETENPNIVKLVDAPFVDEGSLCLPFEFTDGNLRTRIESLNPEDIKHFLYHIINGCNGFHPLIVHRDLKPENILMFESGSSTTAKIADFGLAKALWSLGIELTPYRGTLGFRAPEVLLGSTQYGPPVDMWSVGCIFYEMLTRERFLPGASTLRDLKIIQTKLGKFTKRNMPTLQTLSAQELNKIQPNERFQGLGDAITDLENDCPEAVDLLRRLLAINPEERITATDALDHEYFKNDDDDGGYDYDD